jgi:hypothetical protein
MQDKNKELTLYEVCLEQRHGEYTTIEKQYVFAADMNHANTYADEVLLPNYWEQYDGNIKNDNASNDGTNWYSYDGYFCIKLTDVSPARNLSAVVVDDNGKVVENTEVSI